MSTSIGELYVNLGVKGSEKSIGAIKDVWHELGGMKDSGLAAKAALVGSLYALERLTSAAANHGAELVNMNALTGDSIKYQLQLAEAYRLAHVNEKSAASDIMNANKLIGAYNFDNSLPDGFTQIFGAVGRPADMQKADQWLAKYQEFITKFHDKPGMIQVVNDLVGKSGFSTDFLTMAAKRAAEHDIPISSITKNIQSTGVIKTLDVFFGKWSNLEKRFLLFNEVLTAEFGMPVINFLTKALHETEKLGKQINKVFGSKNKDKTKDAFIIGQEETEALIRVGEIVGGAMAHAFIVAIPPALEILHGVTKGVVSTVADKVSDFVGPMLGLHDKKFSYLWEKLPGKIPKGAFPELTIPKHQLHLLSPQSNVNIKVDQHNHGVPHAENSNEHLAKELKTVMAITPSTNWVA